MSLKRETQNYEEIKGKHVRHLGGDTEVWINAENEEDGMLFVTLPEARAIHAELTELFKLLDEKV